MKSFFTLLWAKPHRKRKDRIDAAMMGMKTHQYDSDCEKAAYEYFPEAKTFVLNR
jgi:hypothetical protein